MLSLLRHIPAFFHLETLYNTLVLYLTVIWNSKSLTCLKHRNITLSKPSEVYSTSLRKKVHVPLEVYTASNPKSKIHAFKRISKLWINFSNTKVHKVKSVNNKINCLHFHGNSKINTSGEWHHNKSNVLTKLKQLQSRNKHGLGSQIAHNFVHINCNIPAPVEMEANCMLQLTPQKCVNSTKTF